MEEQSEQHSVPSQAPRTQNLLTPIAVVIAGLLIAGAVIFTNTPQVSNTTEAQNTEPEPTISLEEMDPITESDHIRGNPNAPIMIVEYSDFDCPFCHRFHETMLEVMDEYGANGEVAWVYRHFPLESLHPNAPIVAVASECAADQGGDTTFWKFADAYFTSDSVQPDLESKLMEIAGTIGINQELFTTCLTSGTHDEEIQAEFANAVATGGRGTPWSILITPDGNRYPINGAQPYASVQAIIEGSL